MLSTIQTNDFTGGLNYRADAFQLAENESPDLLNVDLDPRGGFSQRAGVTDYNLSPIGSLGSAAFTPKRAFFWEGNDRQLLVAANNKVFWTQNGTFADTGAVTTAADGAQFAPWSSSATSLLYSSAGAGTAGFKWDGSTLTTLTASASGAWQDSFASPTGTHMPTADHVATHVDRLWVASTSEDGSAFPDRVRYSHPGFPESWRELDYIDVVGGGRGITGIVSFGDQLLVFKPRAVFAILGYDEDTYQLVPLTTQVGAASPKAIAVSETGVFFFSWPDGLFAYDGQTFTDLFGQLRPIVELGEFADEAADDVLVSRVGRRVLVSLPAGVAPSAYTYNSTEDTYRSATLVYGGQTQGYEQAGVTYDSATVKFDGDVQTSVVTQTFVWDPTIGDGGSWTRYQLGDGYGFGPSTDFVTNAGDRVPVTAHPAKPYVLKVDQTDLYRDTVAGTAFDISSYYVTRWQDAGVMTASKFWRRPELMVRQLGEDTSLTVQVFHDWNRATVDRSFTVALAGEDIAGGYSSWVQPDLGADLVKGSNLGLAKAVQLKVSGAGGQPWGVNAIAYKFNPRRSRV